MINHPLRLAVGSHEAGSGKACAMNVVSWELGDSPITDTPAACDPILAKMVHLLNDTYCIHRGDSDLLCPACSIEVLAVAHRTVGTNNHRNGLWLPRRVDWLNAVDARSMERREHILAIHCAIDACEMYCGIEAVTPPAHIVDEAIRKMLVRT